ncbi:ribosome recycling factor [Candidatus Woesebacteria bacterium]|nr:ribosome recycling factor [Candidatus Woesebacteria bacterium]
MDETLVRQRMQQALELVASDIGGIRTGRATPTLIEGLEVAVYGGTQRLKIRELATIITSEPQLLIIDPWDKSIIGEIRQGILQANIGMNPAIDGEILRIVFPPLTTEDREKYVKLLSSKLENGRVMVRQIRSDVMHELKKKFESKEITEDENFAQEKKLQEITDEFVSKIEAAGEKKKQELLQI